jgi:hypothetical protein
MPRPLNERRSLELELAGTPTTPEFKARREWLDWQIRERGKRLAEVEAR